MGSSSIASWEKPVHTVQLASFDMARSETTVAQYRACAGAGAGTDTRVTGIEHSQREFSADPLCNWNQPDRDDHAMNGVTWEQARAFCRWAGASLASEAQRECAARSGGRNQRYPSGNAEPTCDLVVMGDVAGKGICGLARTWPACSKPAGFSAQGVCDLAGSLCEFVEDGWHESSEGAPDDGWAWVLPGVTFRDAVVRDGGFEMLAASDFLAAARGYASTDGRYAHIGWRCVKPLRRLRRVREDWRFVPPTGDACSHPGRRSPPRTRSLLHKPRTSRRNRPARTACPHNSARTRTGPLRHVRRRARHRLPPPPGAGLRPRRSRPRDPAGRPLKAARGCRPGRRTDPGRAP